MRQYDHKVSSTLKKEAAYPSRNAVTHLLDDTVRRAFSEKRNASFFIVLSCKWRQHFFRGVYKQLPEYTVP
jgi:hypothetical protein